MARDETVINVVHRTRAASIPLNAVRVFDAVARCGSLRAAAEQLGVVPGAVRQQMASLEDNLCVTLLAREGGRVTLTDAGRRFADAAAVALNILIRAADEISDAGRRQRIRLGVPMPMATKWLMPRLSRLMEDLPKLDIDIIPVDLAFTLADRPDLDALIAGGEYRPLPDIAAFSFMKDEFGLVGAPVEADKLLVASNTTKIAATTAIIARDTAHLLDDWFRESGMPPLRFQKRYETETLDLAIAAAKAGLGIVAAPRASIEGELEENKLVAPFGFVTRPVGYRLCCRSVDADGMAIGSLRKWLMHEGADKLPLDAQ
ncbi:LysR substrate-binding domain-containing protein [Rhizobium sp. TRM95796]|uniref:LysR substrate-binding domain-containing protein n=1 Tax=Rhizobium sp. TRM95796 TaxID=2979862 RepID=UPI0021E9A325|nr:LysR family transcriptional regulator [Rhizobium sp. TRM95796]MCV3768131.1 LysR family transcriptional regulator [Rhizobium sp. TRM95796]